MSKTANKIASTFIVAGALAGAFAFTEKLTPGLESLFNQSATPTSSTSSSTAADQTVQGDPIDYMYGTIQVEVVRKSGKISTVNMVQSGATNGRDQAFPPLIQAAVKAQSSNFGNLSGATMTTDAFKQALDSAISKLN